MITFYGFLLSFETTAFHKCKDLQGKFKRKLLKLVINYNSRGILFSNVISFN